MGSTYVFELSHDVHLHVNLLIKDAILHKASFLELLRSEGNTIELGGELIHDSKSPLTYRSNLVVLVSSTPLSDKSANR